jgi:hypothetical protein
MKKIAKIYSEFIDYCESINPEEKRKIENAIVRLSSFIIVITTILLFKLYSNE